LTLPKRKHCESVEKATHQSNQKKDAAHSDMTKSGIHVSVLWMQIEFKTYKSPTQRRYLQEISATRMQRQVQNAPEPI
jgi:hypothetical protein